MTASTTPAPESRSLPATCSAKPQPNISGADPLGAGDVYAERILPALRGRGT